MWIATTVNKDSVSVKNGSTLENEEKDFIRCKVHKSKGSTLFVVYV
jgi:hypothetical protein